MTLQDYFIENTALRSEWAFDRNKEDLRDLKPNSHARVWWRCDKGHEWQARLDSRVNTGRGCPFCAKQVVVPGETDIESADPSMAALWHPTLNGNLRPSDISPGSRKNVWWRCGEGHAWQAPAYSIKRGTLCPYCSGRLPIPGKTDLATTHPDYLARWSPRNTVSPTEVTAGSHKMVWWVCEKGHEWESQVVTYVTQGYGCPYCAGKRAIPGETDLATLRPDLMAEWDVEKNTLDPRELTVAAHEKVWWKCGLGHSWQAVVFSRTREKPNGCPYCAGRLVLPGFNDLATLKPKLAEEWYEPLNGDLTPNGVTLGSNKKAWWRCGDGHVWQAVIYSRTRKKAAGCPVCAGVVKQRLRDAIEAEKRQKRAQPSKVPNKSLSRVNA